MSVETIITQLVAIQAAIDGIKAAHDNTPESINELPCFINFPSSGDIERAVSLQLTTHIIKMQLYVRRADLETAESIARPFIKKTIDAFNAHITLNGTASNSDIFHYDYGGMEFAGTPYLGISFDIRVVEKETVNFS